MTRLSWGNASSRIFEVGIDRGVLYPKSAPAVPWNGLTGVDENGADSSKTYYMDGRPYVIVPQPKEFTATLKAYTYPDEFSALMGTPEITDGMYLDSQMGDSFDLSYRTLIGDAAEGTERGYKIHLVYNASVAAPAKSYATVGSSIEPSDFSWEIETVPVPVDGRRPTAHITIDTRHLDKNRLDQVESLLYGTADVTVTALPRPNTIFDLLNFGDTVLVTDNGDGTWTATGPYQSIVVKVDGSFSISNVVVTLGADGTYAFGEDVLPVDTSLLDGGTPSSTGDDVYDGGLYNGTSDVVYDGGAP